MSIRTIWRKLETADGERERESEKKCNPVQLSRIISKRIIKWNLEDYCTLAAQYSELSINRVFKYILRGNFCRNIVENIQLIYYWTELSFVRFQPFICIRAQQVKRKGEKKNFWYSLHLVCSSYNRRAIFVTNRYNHFYCIQRIYTVEHSLNRRSIVPLYNRANHGIHILHLIWK